jgi:hypothetical protein
MLRWFPRLQVATARFSCSPPDFSFLDPYLIFMYMHNNHCHRATAHLLLNLLLLLKVNLFTASFIHLAVCLMTGSKPLPKRALHIVRYTASSFRCEYPVLFLRLSSSFLCLLPRLPVTHPSFYLSFNNLS